MVQTQPWQGGVFSKELEGGRSGAILHIDPNGIRAVTTKGPQLQMAFEGMQLEVGGASGHMVFCRPPDRSLTFFCDNAQFLDGLGAVAPGPVARQVADLRAQRGRKRAFKTTATIAFIAIVVVLVLTLPGLLRSAVQKSVDAIPVEVDQKLGEVAFSSMDLGGEKVEAPVVVESMQAMVDRLQPHFKLGDMKLQLHVVNSKQVNAFALPGGYMVVYTGLLREATTPDQVAGVIAHEIGHVVHRHGLQRIGKSLGVVAGLELVFGDVTGVAAAAQDLLTVAAINSYSREQESEADATAVAALHAADLDPASLIGFFQEQVEEEKKAGEDESTIDSEVLSWMSSHPDHQERMASMGKQIARLEAKPTRPLSIDWVALIAALPSSK